MSDIELEDETPLVLSHSRVSSQPGPGLPYPDLTGPMTLVSQVVRVVNQSVVVLVGGRGMEMLVVPC